MSETSKVSVIIPAYNSEQHIGRLLDSLAKQTYRNFEVVLVDDCSTDNTFEVAKKFMEENKINYRALKLSRNLGESCARNEGLKLAKGRYVCLVDHDDALKPTYLEKLVNKADKENLDLVFCGFYEIDANDGSVISRYDERFDYITGVINGIDCFKKNIKDEILVMIWATLFSKELIDRLQLRFPPFVKVFGDAEFVYKAFLESERVSSVPELLYCYYRHSRQTTRQKWHDKLEYCFSVGLSLKMMKYIREKGYDEELITLLERYYTSRQALKMLSNFILQGNDDTYWKALQNPKIREMLRYSYPTFFDKPEVPFKAFLALHFPKIFYRRYVKQREKNLKKHQQEICYFQERQ